jgi:hypothetical protein
VGALRAKPVCAICQKPVDRVHEEEDAVLDRWILTAYCHGERERVVLSFTDVSNGPISFGVAFSDVRRLTP